MTSEIQIVDRGRGLQLSTSRVTVQDLVPYFQENCSNEEIMRWIPTLSNAEIDCVRAYYLANRSALDEEDRVIKERNQHNKNPEWVEKLLQDARLERLAIAARARGENQNGVAP